MLQGLVTATMSIRIKPFGRRSTFSNYSVGGRSFSKSKDSVSSITLTSASPVKNGFSSYGVINGAIGLNDKETMKCLNDRLANYLDQVRSLEKTNQELEIKIQEKMVADTPVVRDLGPMFDEANALGQQIAKATQENARLLLSIDNAKLAAGDYKMKLETEMSICHSVEQDIASLKSSRNAHEDFIGSLKVHLDSLLDELHCLNKNHKEEMSAIQRALDNAKVDVEVDVVQGPDLASILGDVRAQYEEVVKKNKEEADALFQAKVNGLMMAVELENQAAETAKEELTQKRRHVQGLELELGTLKNQVNALKGNLEESDHTYRSALDDLREAISKMEAELQEIHRNMHSEKLEYETLLRIKETLENEIAVYRRLLGGEEVEKPIPPIEPESKTTKIVKVVTQTVVDGKVVDESSEVEEFEVIKNKK